MLLEKIVVDWYTLYAKPTTISEMKNCIIYTSLNNIECLKKKINELFNDRDMDETMKEFELNLYNDIVKFIKRNMANFNDIRVQSDKLEFKKENNSYFIIVRETKDITQNNPKLENIKISREENEAIFIALSEGSQFLTIDDTIIELINKNEIPVFCVNISQEK